MIFGFLILITALALSIVAAFYSISGLVAIFAAAPIPIIVMGSTLEIAKVVTTVFLHNNWKRLGIVYKTYLVPAVAILMFLTSVGIFGLLSKAHSDQVLISGDVQSKIAIYDEKIKLSKDNIDAARKALKQMDEAVDQVMARSTTENGAARSVSIRRSQNAERQRLLQEIDQDQKKITSINEERAPIAAEIRKIEADVGPIRYIAALIYGDNPDSNLLERAVRWVIILIVIVFDPLALCLILSANKQFEWALKGEGGWVHDKPKEEGSVAIPDVKKADLIETPDDKEFIPEYVEEVTLPIEETKFDIKNHPYLFTPPGSQTPPGIEPALIQVHHSRTSDTTIDPCYKCGTELVNAPGIGLVCPNNNCGLSDNLAEHELDNGELTADQLLQIGEMVNQSPPDDAIASISSSIIDKELGGYIQNEEQSESSVWSSTITKSEYNEVSETEEHRRDVLVNQWANLVRTRQAKMTDVPQHIMLDVRARV